MSLVLHHCAARDCGRSILVTDRGELALPHGAVQTVLAAEGWGLSLEMWPTTRERALCLLHFASYEAGEAELCSRCALPFCECHRGAVGS